MICFKESLRQNTFDTFNDWLLTDVEAEGRYFTVFPHVTHPHQNLVFLHKLDWRVWFDLWTIVGKLSWWVYNMYDVVVISARFATKPLNFIDTYEQTFFDKHIGI